MSLSPEQWRWLHTLLFEADRAEGQGLPMCVVTVQERPGSRLRKTTRMRLLPGLIGECIGSKGLGEDHRWFVRVMNADIRRVASRNVDTILPPTNQPTT